MSVRTGFVARGFIPFSTNVVSFGYGGISDELIEPEPAPEDELIPGAPGPTQMADTLDGPKVYTQGPRKVEAEPEPRPQTRSRTIDAPTPIISKK
jgi:hypothetical protein